MNAGKVVALEEIISVDLPVAFHLVLTALVEFHALEIEFGSLLWNFAQRWNQIGGVRIKVYEDPQ